MNAPPAAAGQRFGEALAADPFAGKVREFLALQPDPPRRVRWREVLAIAARTQSIYHGILVCGPVAGTMLMLHGLGVGAPKGDGSLVAFLSGLAIAAYSVVEMLRYLGELRRALHAGTVREVTVDSVIPLVESPSGYSGGAQHGVRMHFRLGAVDWDHRADHHWANDVRGGTRVVVLAAADESRPIILGARTPGSR